MALGIEQLAISLSEGIVVVVIFTQDLVPHTHPIVRELDVQHALHCML